VHPAGARIEALEGNLDAGEASEGNIHAWHRIVDVDGLCRASSKTGFIRGFELLP